MLVFALLAFMGGLMTGLMIIDPRRHADAREWFVGTDDVDTSAAMGIDTNLVRDHHSLSAPPFRPCGLRSQTLPHPQAKLA